MILSDEKFLNYYFFTFFALWAFYIQIFQAISTQNNKTEQEKKTDKKYNWEKIILLIFQHKEKQNY